MKVRSNIAKSQSNHPIRTGDPALACWLAALALQSQQQHHHHYSVRIEK